MSAELTRARLERQVLGAARVSRFLSAVDEIRRLLAREDPRLRAEVLKLTAPKIGPDLAAAVASAFNLGVTDAVRVLGKEPKRVPKKPPAGLILAARATEASVAGLISTAKKLARAGANPETFTASVSAARNVIERDVVTLVNHAGNAGTTAVADAAGVATVWIAETNACVECLAYSGRIARPGKTFPGGLTYGAKSYNPEPVKYPPRHPRCRCTVEPLVAPEYADALRREADRSVLRGFSLPSESMKTRVDAAARLIENDVDAPKSVVAFARRAVKAGAFPTRGRP